MLKAWCAQYSNHPYASVASNRRSRDLRRSQYRPARPSLVQEKRRRAESGFLHSSRHTPRPWACGLLGHEMRAYTRGLRRERFVERKRDKNFVTGGWDEHLIAIDACDQRRRQRIWHHAFLGLVEGDAFCT